VIPGHEDGHAHAARFQAVSRLLGVLALPEARLKVYRDPAGDGYQSVPTMQPGTGSRRSLAPTHGSSSTICFLDSESPGRREDPIGQSDDVTATSERTSKRRRNCDRAEAPARFQAKCRTLADAAAKTGTRLRRRCSAS